MSPEQANCDELDGRSDLYAVGNMLWELLAVKLADFGGARAIRRDGASSPASSPNASRARAGDVRARARSRAGIG